VKRLRLPAADSLRARLIWLAAGTTVVCLALAFALIWTIRVAVVDSRLADAVALSVAVIRGVIQHTPADQRAALLREARVREPWTLVRDSEARLPHDLPLVPALRQLEREVNARLPDAEAVRLEGGPDVRLWVPLTLEGERWWAVVPLAQLPRLLRWQLLGAIVLVMAAVLLLAIAMAIRIARPLTQLSHAARSLAAGHTLDEVAVPGGGPREVRELTREFVTMVRSRDAALETRRVMLAGLPHDLKAPLTRLRARLELVGEAAVRDGLRGDAADMQRLLEQFLAFLRGADPAAYQRTPVDLGVLIRERCSRWASSGTDVRCGQLPAASITGDADLLARALDNLIENALRYGGAPVQVELRAAAGTAEIRVADHGPGIPADRRDEALQPFTRLDAARSGGGVGIGLALADAIARGHGGGLTLQDTPGGGLTVSLRLPQSGGTIA
jgi:two-component system osmolarity sensor histidine kinase EnvZ